MIIVVSQAWTKDTEASAEGYVQASADFLSFMERHQGFRGRKLIRSLEDATHFTNLRWFDSVDDYTAMTEHPDYATQIAKLAEFLNLDRYTDSPREFMEVVLDDGGPDKRL
jgi:heme-degrading monooxygenase HmoA